MLGYQLMGAVDCIAAVVSDVQWYNINNKHIEIQPHKTYADLNTNTQAIQKKTQKLTI